MADLLEDLKNALASEKEAYRELLRFSEQKKEALVRNDIGEVNALVRRESQCLKRARELGRCRTDLTALIAKERGLDAPDTDAVIRLAKGSLGRELEAIIDELKQAAQQLRRCNELNRTLVQAHLQYNAFCIDLLSQNAQAGETYGHTGQVNPQAAVSRGLLDQKA